MLKIHVIDATHGDCLLLDFDHSKILIDCGPKSFKARRDVLANIEKILGENSVIDIAIVTHNDDDHIGGFEFLLDTSIKINTIVFNSLQDIPDIIKNSQKQISYNQDNALKQRLLAERGIKTLCLTRDSSPLIINDITLTAITPTAEALECMLNDANVQKEREEQKRRRKQISSSKAEEIKPEEALQKIQSGQDVFVKDQSITNKSSIGLVIQYGSFSGLFLGDAHAEDVIEGLNILGFNNHQFDVVKISHHGSERNTNIESLSLLGKTDYILCANNEKHYHPNNMTLARILSLDNTPTIHLSSDNPSLVGKINDFKSLGFSINDSYPTKGVNTLSYEYK
ncbi:MULTISPECIES: ComEC/Rec2 family competence protein [Acinetobacter]|uniref:ComEC/Rec2 family competence protein n=1 Tax=Acinetobacter TaxID=469 RepID=UPI00143BC2BE|nr:MULTISPECIES: MBL fold metallo-hydrolase [Acinetobacter]MDD0801756.1 MBL fold metallo-hydrolase [Acinetobacter sp. Gutcm_16]NKG37861.1 MBL fold metallo-hydrolase [Acinetobacter johnsonii]